MQFTHIQCCGSGMFIPDPGSDFFPSRIRTVSIPDPGSASKNLSILTPKKPKKWFLSSRKYDPGCSSRISDPGSGCWLSTHPGSRIQGSKRHRIPAPDPQHCLSLGLHKGRPSYRRSLQPSKKNIQHFITWKFCPFFLFFVGHFCPPGSGSAIWMRIRIQNLLMRIRIRNPAFQSNPLSCKNGGNCIG